MRIERMFIIFLMIIVYFISLSLLKIKKKLDYIQINEVGNSIKMGATRFALSEIEKEEDNNEDKIETFRGFIKRQDGSVDTLIFNRILSDGLLVTVEMSED